MQEKKMLSVKDLLIQKLEKRIAGQKKTRAAIVASHQERVKKIDDQMEAAIIQLTALKRK